MDDQPDLTKPIATVGDPDAPLSVAAMILAGQQLRLSGNRGPIEYRLHVEQANDIDTALVSTGPDAHGRHGLAFRNAPVVVSGLWAGSVVAPEDGVRVDIVSSRHPLNAAEWVAWGKPGADPNTRQPDPRKADLSAEQVAALKAEVERQRLAMRSPEMVAIDELRTRMDEAGIP